MPLLNFEINAYKFNLTANTIKKRNLQNTRKKFVKENVNGSVYKARTMVRISKVISKNLVWAYFQQKQTLANYVSAKFFKDLS